MRSFVKKKGFNYLIGIAIGLALPWIVGLAGGYWVHMLVIVIIFAILAVSLNLVMGYTGQVNLAHIAFFGIGAYTSALLVMRLDVNFWLALVAGGLMAVIFSLLLGNICLRLKGIYFALSTMAFVMLVGYVCNNWVSLTGGTLGLVGIPPPSIAGFVFQPANRVAWYYLVFAFLLLTMFIVDRVINSRVGRAFTAIREDEDLAESTGVNTTLYKVLSFSISVFLAGIAGGLYASYLTCMTPADCAIVPSIMVIAMCVIGGLGTMQGPVIGAIIVQLLPEVLRAAEEYYMLIFGLLVLLVVIFAPNGIMGVITSLQARRKARGSSSSAQTAT